MPHATFLLPGVGAQGGRVGELAAAFDPGRAGGLVSASRSIAEAHRAGDADPPTAARAAAERLRDAAWALSESAAGQGV
jgi:orotidine-5'-phosphate decarboxylase